MKKLVQISIGCFLGLSLIAQERIVLKDNAFMVLQNGAQLIIDNSASNAISLAGTGGNIISENETNKVKWNLNTATGTYTIPFTKAGSKKIPLSMVVNTAGSGNGSVLFSTFGGTSWDNTTYLPSDVTSFESIFTSNNSASVIDRFWVIAPTNYTAKPEVSFTFTYLDEEVTAGSNTIDEATLVFQRFNPDPTKLWGDWIGPAGNVDAVANTVSSGVVSSQNFFQSWTLSSISSPLPIELLYFKVSCLDENNQYFEWETASETNNNYFEVEKSIDGSNWTSLKKIPSNLNTSESHQKYSFTYYSQNNEQSSTPGFLYRLKQVDFDNKQSYSNVVASDCNNYKSDEIHVFPNPTSGTFMVNFYGLFNGSDLVEIRITDMFGHIIESKEIKESNQVYDEYFNIENTAKGVYFVSIISKDNTIVKKIVHQ